MFDELTSLQWLYLSRNDMSALPAGVFDALTLLQFLDLDNNAISALRTHIA